MKDDPKLLKLTYQPWTQILTKWPKELPIVSLLSKDGWFIIACSFDELSWQQFCKMKIISSFTTLKKVPIPFVGGQIGLISYDSCASHLAQKGKTESRVYDVKTALVGHIQRKQLYLVSQTEKFLSHRCQYHLSKGHLDKILNLASSEQFLQQTYDLPWKINPTTSAQSYLENARTVIEAILNGRFYQLNLLRFFNIEAQLTRQAILSKLIQQYEPYSAWFDFPEYQLISFSPEQFCKWQPISEGCIYATTHPIKGTAQRGQTEKEDIAKAHMLLNSKKDLAELHMIIDLMRNDLNRISLSGSVKVVAANELKTFAHVHHLVASVASFLKPDLQFGEIINALCPAGSITGAPKLEVIKAIAEIEPQNRGYFMGNAFYYDLCGRFDSSVLIRTAVRNLKSSNNFQYAAGSGLTRQSVPDHELAEIYAKCAAISKWQEGYGL